MIAATDTPVMTSTVSALPAISLAFRSLPAPISRLYLDAPPIPRSSAAAVEIVVTRKAIFVAAFPSIPTN